MKRQSFFNGVQTQTLRAIATFSSNAPDDVALVNFTLPLEGIIPISPTEFTLSISCLQTRNVVFTLSIATLDDSSQMSLTSIFFTKACRKPGKLKFPKKESSVTRKSAANATVRQVAAKSATNTEFARKSQELATVNQVSYTNELLVQFVFHQYYINQN